MKYLITLLLLFLFWKIWRDFERFRQMKTQYQAKETALAEFESLLFRLEMKQANGELTAAEFQALREQALERLKMKLERELS